MLIPLGSVDILYYKKMYWHYNNLSNKSKDEDKQLGEAFVHQLVEKAFSFIEEIFNTGNDYHLDSLQEIINKDGFAGELVAVVELELSKLREKARTLGWDPRLKINVRLVSIGNASQNLVFSMDLDKTFDELEDGKLEEVFNSPFISKEIIDNPSAEELNDYFNKSNKKS